MNTEPLDVIDSPTEAWVTLHSGQRINCPLTRTGPRTWTASPARPLAPAEVESAYVDRIPPQSDVLFDFDTTGDAA